jgi:hypothetical protein
MMVLMICERGRKKIDIMLQDLNDTVEDKGARGRKDTDFQFREPDLEIAL